MTIAAEDPKGLSNIDNAVRNRRIILNIIKDRGPMSRKDVTELNNLSTATTKRLIEGILQDDLAVEVEAPAGVKRRGRKASFLALNGRFGFSIGVGVTTGEISVNALDFSGKALLENRIPCARADKDVIIGEIRKGVGSVLEAGSRKAGSEKAGSEKAGSKEQWGKLLGIGVGIPGIVDARSGVVLFSPVLPDWENVQLRSLLKEQFDAEVMVDDSVRCMALAERRAGVGKDIPTFLFVYVGDGVGSGIFLDNRLFRGSNGIAGELGHITIREGGPLCRCGNHGCLEALVSIGAIRKRIDNRLSEKVFTSLKTIFDAKGRVELRDIYAEAEKGDKLSSMVIDETAGHIGTGVADVVNFLDPGTVVLGGEVVESFGDLLVDGVKRSVRLRGIPAITQRTRILKSSLGPHSAAFGAASLMIESFLGNPVTGI